jgi:demethoxyubiquinone hydroxylase (CLK1/Coq7/Cat5 family)
MSSLISLGRLVVRAPTLYIARSNSNASNSAPKIDSKEATRNRNGQVYKSLSPESRTMLDRMLRVDHAG